MFSLDNKVVSGEEYKQVLNSQQRERLDKFEEIKRTAKTMVGADGQIEYLTLDGTTHRFGGNQPGTTMTVNQYIAQQREHDKVSDAETNRVIRQQAEYDSYIADLKSKKGLSDEQARAKAGYPLSEAGAKQALLSAGGNSYVNKGQPKDTKGNPVMGVPYTLE